jgi:hypothetical protein
VGKRIPSGVLFLATLVLSWTLVTAAIGMAVWSERNASTVRLATWMSLWTFTVLAPTLNAFAIHRSVAALTNPGTADSPADRLARLPTVVLLTANMAVLSAFALIFGR